jgi:hypothetical protein
MKTIYKYFIAACYKLKLNLKSRMIKKLVLTGCILLVFTSAYGQVDLKPGETIYFNMGYDHTFINGNAFDAWTRANFNLTEKYRDGAFFDLGSFINRFDAGLDAEFGNRVSTVNVYFGRELTSRNSTISSWLNIGIGAYYYELKNIAPVNYMLTPDEIGQKLELHYTATTLSLTSKNYLKIFRIKSKVQKKNGYINSGFFVSAGYQFNTPKWQYGYYNTDTVFTARTVHTIPKLSKMQVNAGVFIGI